MLPKIIAYIDGFNLYYLLRRYYPNLKWLDLVCLVENLLGRDYDIIRVNYYTAQIYGTDGAERQKNYWNALKKHAAAQQKDFRIHLGKFNVVEKQGKLITEGYTPPLPPLPRNFPRIVKISAREEKRTDVTLASHMVEDAFCKKCDAVAIITNDSDFLEAIRAVKTRAKLPVWLLSPTRHQSGIHSPHVGLENLVTADFFMRIRRKHLVKAQLPKRIPNTDITRPKGWG
ncbi:MAG: NYN domain-containing protein [Proteobacteria bacterium]|nr:NYN domain-containing protein [Pseudomonadota bacterium]